MLLYYAFIVLVVAFISYDVMFSMVLYPPATILFSVTTNIPNPFNPSPPRDPSLSTYSILSIIPYSTAQLNIRRTCLNCGALPHYRLEANLLTSYLKPTYLYLPGIQFQLNPDYNTPFYSTYILPGAHCPSLQSYIISISFSLEAHLQVLLFLCSLFSLATPLVASPTSSFEEGLYRVSQSYVNLPANFYPCRSSSIKSSSTTLRASSVLYVFYHIHHRIPMSCHDFFLSPGLHCHPSLLRWGCPNSSSWSRILLHGWSHGHACVTTKSWISRRQRPYTVPAARIRALCDTYVEMPPLPATTRTENVCDNRLQRIIWGRCYNELIRKQSLESTLFLLILDLILLLIPTYLALWENVRELSIDAFSTYQSFLPLPGRSRRELSRSVFA